MPNIFDIIQSHAGSSKPDWAGLGNLLQEHAFANMPTAEATMARSWGGFGGSLQGALAGSQAQMQQNAQVQRDQAQQAWQNRMAERAVDDRNNKFSMLFKALIGDPDQISETNRRGVSTIPFGGGQQTATGYSPLMTAMNSLFNPQMNPVGRMAMQQQTMQGNVPFSNVPFVGTGIPFLV